MNAETNSIPARLKDIRLYYDYKQTEIAKVLGISRGAYCHYEHYRSVVPLNRIITLANFYEINLDYLLALTNVKEKAKPFKIDLQVISNNLIEIRRINNLSVSDLAKELNIHISYIYYFEARKRLITTPVCYDIAKRFNISVDYLLGRSSSKYIKK